MKIKDKLRDLKCRADKIKADDTIRHKPNNHDTVKCYENAVLMKKSQEITFLTKEL